VDPALSIASTALNAQRTEIDVTSENIANAQTPGYLQETANLNALPGGDINGVGDGVAVTGVIQANNAMLTANNWQAQGALSNLSSLQSVLSGIENIFPLGETASSSSTSTSTNNSISGQLASFWSSFDGVAQDPSATAPRTQVIDLAEGLTSSLNEASTQLGQLTANTNAQLTNNVGQLNALLGQAASLNGSINQTVGAGGDPSQLSDELNNVLNQLSSIAGVQVAMRSNGTASISLGGINVVQDTTAQTISVHVSGSSTTLETGSGVTAPVSGGTIAGLLSGLNQYIPQFQSQLDGIANNLATTVNGQLAAGYDANGNPGTTPLFTGTTAATIAVNPAVVADPSLIAAASTSGAAAANDGSNAQAMAELANSTTGPDSNYQSLIANIGSVTQNVNTQVSAQTSVANQAQTAVSAATGVNQDTELTNLIGFQQNYEAAAKLLSVVDETIQSLLTAV
jgi:flagellar hook-associated protein 1 FlgK